MPINPNAAIEVTAFAWVPEGPRGLVKDLRVRWALEEAGLDYRLRVAAGRAILPPPGSVRHDAFKEQPRLHSYGRH